MEDVSYTHCCCQKDELNCNWNSFHPLPARIITACGACISTDELLRSLSMLCAPQADKLFNYRLWFEESS